MRLNQQILVVAASLAAVWSLGGCASPFASNASTYSDSNAFDDQAAGSRGGMAMRAGEPGATGAADAITLGPTATADDYVDIALQRHPAIRAAELRIRRLAARVPQTTALDDPMLQVAPFGEMAETAAGEVGVMTQVSQRFPLSDKLQTRGRIAEQDVAMARADLQQTRLAVAADVRRAYWAHYFTARAIESTNDSRILLNNLSQLAEAQYRAGTRGQADVLRASVELANLDSDLVLLEQRQATAQAMLNQLIDRRAKEPLPTPAVMQPAAVDAQLDDLLKQASLHNPSIQRMHERIEQERQRQVLAKQMRRPDLNVSLNYNIVNDEGLSPVADGSDQWWLGFGINLPIWAEKYDAAEREARLGVLEGVADLHSQHNRVAFDVQDAYLKVEAQQQLAELFNNTIIPQARQTVEASSSGYRAGSVEFLTLVDNWRRLLGFELMYHRAVVDMQQAIADLERAVGSDVAAEADTPEVRDE